MSHGKILKEEDIDTGIILFKSVRDDNNKIIDLEWELIDSIKEELNQDNSLVGKRLLEEKKGPITRELFENYVQVIETGKSMELLYQRVSDGKKNWFHITAIKRGESLIVSCNDITKFKESEETLKKNEAAYKFLTSNILDWIVRVDPKGHYRYSSPSSKILTGYEPDELLNKSFYELLDPEVVSSGIDDLESQYRDKPEGLTSEFRLRMKDGTYKWCEAVSKPLFDENNHLVEIQSCIRDISQRKKDQKEMEKLNAELEQRVKERTQDLEQKQKELQLIADALPVMISYLDKDLNFKFVNQTFYQWLGKEEVERILTHSLDTIIHEATFEDSYEVLKEVLSGSKRQFEHVLKDKHGQIRHLKSSVIPDYGQDGEVLGYVVINIDITEEKLAQQEANLANERLMTVVNNIPVVFWAVDEQGVFTILEGKALEALGLKSGEQVGMSALELYKDYPDIVENIYKALKGNGFNVSLKINDVTFQSYYSPIKDLKGNIKGMVGISTDISDRIRMEEELLASEAKYKTMAEGIPQMVWTAHPDGKIDFYNQNWIKYTGLTSKEGLTDGWGDIIHPLDYEQALEAWEKSLASGTELKIEARLKRVNDGIYRWHLIRAWPIKNRFKKVLKWLGTCTDIHDQKEQNEELQSKNFELIRTNNDLDNFVYTASHDLKAPISNIEGLVKAIEEEISPRCENGIKDMIAMTRESVQRLKKTISELTEISRLQKSIDEDVDEIDIAEAIEDFKMGHKEQVEMNNVKFDLKLNPGKIMFSKKNFRSIIYNLLNNAIKYRHPERDPEISIRTERYKRKCIVMSITDNGIGFDMKNKEKMFGLFKRLHSHVDGTGIGLYIVKRIIENKGGQIKVESKEGEGSTFYLYFMS